MKIKPLRGGAWGFFPKNAAYSIRDSNDARYDIIGFRLVRIKMSDQRLLRGGAWGSDADRLYSAIRDKYWQGYLLRNIGLRLIKRRKKK